MSTDKKIFVSYQKELGKQIKSIRENQGLSQLDVASRCTYEKTTISRIENGRTNITLKTLVTLSLALEVELEEFFNFEVEPPKE